MVDLPVSAIANRVIGTLDPEAAPPRGERRLEPDQHVLEGAGRQRRNAAGSTIPADRSAGAPVELAAVADYWGAGAAGVRGVGRESGADALGVTGIAGSSASLRGVAF